MVELDSSTGRRLWRMRLPPGQSTSAATVLGGRLYVGASFTSEATSGPRSSAASPPPPDGSAGGPCSTVAPTSSGAPVLANGLVTVDSAKGHALDALDPATGREVRPHRLEGMGRRSSGPSPAGHDRRVERSGHGRGT
jgi:outer membrane protein assembly factor BamB